MLELSTGRCNNCTGLDKCDKYCILHAGKAIVDLIDRVDTVETKIGDFDSREVGGKPDLIVSGHQIWDMANDRAWIMSDIKTTMDMSDKFKPIYDKTAIQVINTYSSYMKFTKERLTGLVDRITRINKNRLLIVPLKPNSQCLIDYELNGVKNKRKESVLKYIKWTNNKDTFKLDCVAGFEVNVGYGNTKIIRKDISNYMKDFRLSKLELKSKSKNHDDSLLQLTSHGLFRPIEVRGKGVTFAIDGTYMYSIENGEIRIVGYWDNNKLVKLSTLKSNAANKIIDNEKYIESHKKYIAPYLMYGANVIEL